MKKMFITLIVCLLGLMLLTESFAAINTEMMTVRQKKQIETYKDKILDEEAPAGPKAKVFYIVTVAAICVSLLLLAMFYRIRSKGKDTNQINPWGKRSN